MLFYIMELSIVDGKILDQLGSLREDIAEFRGEFRALNEAVISNTKRIENNTASINTNEKIISKWVGGLCAITFIVNFAAIYIVNTA